MDDLSNSDKGLIALFLGWLVREIPTALKVVRFLGSKKATAILESGDSSECVPTKTPFEKQVEGFGVQETLSKILQANLDNCSATLQVKEQLIQNGEQIRQSTNVNRNVIARLERLETTILEIKPWDGKKNRREDDPD